MEIYQKTKNIVYKSAETLNKKLELRSVKRIKRFTIIIFAILIVLDIVFVLPNPFPTFSRIVLDSSPKYMFIIFLWGIMTANIFFSRKVKHIIRVKLFGLVLMIVITMVLYMMGSQIAGMSTELECENFESRTQPVFTELICRNSAGEKIDCISSFEECRSTKYDITTMNKLSLLIFGFVFGYLLWPQIEQDPRDTST